MIISWTLESVDDGVAVPTSFCLRFAVAYLLLSVTGTFPQLPRHPISEASKWFQFHFVYSLIDQRGPYQGCGNNDNLNLNCYFAATTSGLVQWIS